VTEALNNSPMHPRLPAPHYGGGSVFEQEASRRWGLSLLDARAMLVIVKNNGIGCATLGDQLWGKPGRGNCSCPWARPAGVVMKRLRDKGLVERDRNVTDRIFYRPTRLVERFLTALRVVK
jgi:hypothetical protein